MIADKDVVLLARIVGLEIDPGIRTSVARALDTLMGQVNCIMVAPLPPELEPAPVFRP